jgi:hypothetical protein
MTFPMNMAAGHGRAIVPAVLVLLFALASCDHGLGPIVEDASTRTGFGGTIRVVSPWPPADSLIDFRVVAFRHYPPTSIVQDFLEGRLEFSEPLSVNVSEQRYQIEKDTLSGDFVYIVVAQQYGPNAFENWRVVAVYSVPGTPFTPATVSLTRGRFVENVDLTVDFHHLPPQPF